MADGKRKHRAKGHQDIEAVGQTVQIQRLLDRLQTGDESARKELIDCACARLERLTRKMLHSWQRVHRWEETGDVLQNALLRLYRSLAEVRPPKAIDFFRLAALNIRRELHDLAKHHYGPRGEGMNHATVVVNYRDEHDLARLVEAERESADDGPVNLAAWAEFHRLVSQLPQEERELFDLLWYQELSQAEAAELLAVSERTVKRRWASARLQLHELLAKTLPDFECKVPG
jgi:RNA polymerase sigma factor (sigma-70 family)